MVNELDLLSSASKSEIDDTPIGRAGFEIIHWVNRSLQSYKEHPPKTLVDAVVQSTGATYEEAEKQVSFDDIVDYILKQLEAGYSKYSDHLEKTRTPNSAVLRQILNQQK